MIGLLAVGLVAGVIAGISPCVLPVLPVLLVAGATERTGEARAGWKRSFAVIVGLIISFTALTLGGSALLSALGLPQDLLRDIGLALLGLIGLGLLIPALGELVARPFASIRIPTLSGARSGFVLGLGLGAVFIPCAGPVLTAITFVADTKRVDLESVLLTLTFSIGAAIPLFVVALAGGEIVAKSRQLRSRAPFIRSVGGIVLIAMSIVLATNVAGGLQRSVPGYTSALQKDIEGTTFATHQLSSLTSTKTSAAAVAARDSCVAGASALQQCGRAAAFTGIDQWLNTPGGRPLTLQSLRGKVVLVDFWTYSCINCQRSLPHVEAWYARYHSDGFVVVGIHTPEFAFEHVVGNVRTAAAQLGVHYPVGIDNNYATWQAYGNDVWPADYLIDADGTLRYFSYGEGGYSTTETLIRQLLADEQPGLVLPPRTDVPDRTPVAIQTPETYLGYDELQYLANTLVESRPNRYVLPNPLTPGLYALSGTWTVNAQESTAGADAHLEYGVDANDVYLVLGGHGRVTVSLNGKTTKQIEVRGIPRLYTLASAPDSFIATLRLGFTPGVQAYDFTFG